MNDLVQRPHDAALPLVPCTMVDDAYLAIAPERFDNSTELPVSAARLFEIFADPDSWSRWGTGIGTTEWTSPLPLRPGSTRTVTFWGGAKVYEDFFIFEPGRRMAFCFYGSTELIWKSFMEYYEVEDLGGDRCRMNWSVAYEPAGGFGKVHPWIRPIMRWNLRSYMWRLRRYCRRVGP